MYSISPIEVLYSFFVPTFPTPKRTLQQILVRYSVHTEVSMEFVSVTFKKTYSCTIFHKENIAESLTLNKPQYQILRL